MKKLFCVLAAMLLGLTAASALASAPSKSTSDMPHFDVEAGGAQEESGFYVRPAKEQDSDYEMRMEINQKEVDKLASFEALADYFGAVTDSEGKPVDPLEMLEADKVNVFEFFPVVAGNYLLSYGDVNVEMELATPYQLGEKLVVMLGFVTVHEDGTQDVEWFAYHAVGMNHPEDEGKIRMTLKGEHVDAIQKGIALMAVLSK